jgi:polyribonucleotide nucleotidyltransferase
MDFKVAGSADAITAFQLDIKVEGITLPILRTALEAAREGRRAVLGAMARCAPPPAGELSPHAPRILSLTVPADKIGALIGPGGRNIRSLQEATGAEIMVSLGD